MRYVVHNLHTKAIQVDGEDRDLVRKIQWKEPIFEAETFEAAEQWRLSNCQTMRPEPLPHA